MRAGVSPINAVTLIHKRLMPMFLGTECARNILGALHHFPTLVVKTEH